MITRPEPVLDRVLRLAGFVLNLSGARVALVSPEPSLLMRQYGIELRGLGEVQGADGVAGCCERVIAAGEPIVCSDTDPPLRGEDGAELPRPRFFLGLPLRAGDGRTLAVLYASDDSPRQVSAEQLAMLQLLVEQLGEQLELQRSLIGLRAEGAERERERATLLAMLDQSPAMISFWDVNETNVYANDRHREYFGVTGAQIKDRHIRELLGPHYEVNKVRRQAALGGAPQRFEYSLSLDSGERRDLDLSYVPFFYQGAVTGLIVLATDVTQRNQAALSLARSESTQRALLAALPGIYLRLSPGGRVTALFGRTSEDLGIHSGEQIERSWRDLKLSPEFNQLFERIEAADWSRCGLHEVHVLEQEVKIRGEVHHIEARVAQPPGSMDRACLLLDITDRRIQEQALRDYSAHLDALIDAAPDCMLTTDVHGNITQANAMIERLLGYSPVEVLGQNVRIFTPQVAQRLHDEYVHAYPQMDERAMRNREVVALRKDGSSVNVEVSVTSFLLSGTTHYLAVIRDVSERQINRARSEFVAMVSHELRTPLHSVMGMAEVLMEDCSALTPQQRDYLSTILDGARHLNALVSDILDLSRIELGTLRLDLAPVSAQRLCDLCTAMVSEAAQRKGVRLKNQRRKQDLTLSVDARRINQILLNLLDNAIKFTPSGGSVQLCVQRSRAGIEFRVKDTGIGISKRDSERLFMPFSQLDSSTQRKYQGTGIGLYLSRRLAVLHGGNLNFRKPARGGSLFVLTLPTSRLVAKRTP